MLNNSCLRRTLIMIMIPVSISIGLQQTPFTSLSFMRISYFPNCESSRKSTYEVSYHCKIHKVSLYETFYVHSTSKNASLDATVSEIQKTCNAVQGSSHLSVFPKKNFFLFMEFAFYAFWSPQNQQNCSK